jgi:2-methylcitrate dehydratase PrpD
LFRDPRDPASFDDSALSDAAIRAMCGRVSVVVGDPPTRVAGASIVTVQLKNGRSVSKEVEEFNGTPARPLDRVELKDKFMTLMRVRYGAAAGELFDRLQGLENETELGWIGA